MYFYSDRTLTIVTGFLEVFVVVPASLPVTLNLLSYCWRDAPWLSDKLIVFFAPVYFGFFFVGSTYASWTLAVVGLAASYWMMRRYDIWRRR